MVLQTDDTYEPIFSAIETIYRGDPSTFFSSGDMLDPNEHLLPLRVPLYNFSDTSVVCGFVPYQQLNLQLAMVSIFL